MKHNTKSSITLPPNELKMVTHLMKKIGAKSKVEVIRTCLKFFMEKMDRDNIRLAYQNASNSVRDTHAEEMKSLESLDYDGLEDK